MTQARQARNPIRRTVGIAAIAAGNIALGRFCGDLAFENISSFVASPTAGPEPPAFVWFYLLLSGVTPALLLMVAVCLGMGFAPRYAAAWRVAWVVQRMVFWAFLLRSVAQILPTFFLPNEGVYALMSLVTGIL